MEGEKKSGGGGRGEGKLVENRETKVELKEVKGGGERGGGGRAMLRDRRKRG